MPLIVIVNIKLHKTASVISFMCSIKITKPLLCRRVTYKCIYKCIKKRKSSRMTKFLCNEHVRNVTCMCINFLIINCKIIYVILSSSRTNRSFLIKIMRSSLHPEGYPTEKFLLTERHCRITHYTIYALIPYINEC